MDYWAYIEYNRQAINEYLAHHGVKGQSWGDRKYQYEDGSLTPEGKIHYGVGDGSGRQPQKAKTQNKKSTSGSSSGKTKAELERELEEARLKEQKHKRNMKIAIAAGITATAVVGIVLGKKLHDKNIENRELQAQAEEGRNKLSELTEKYGLLNKDLESTKASLERSQSNLKNVSENFKKVSEDIKENKNLKKSVEEKQNEVNFFRTQHEAATREIGKLNQRQSQLKINELKARKEAKSLKEENEILKGINAKVTDAYSNEQKRSKNLGNKLLTSRAETVSQRKVSNTLRSDIDKAHKELSITREKAQKAETAFKASEAANKMLMTTMEEAQSISPAYKNTISSLFRKVIGGK